MDSSNEGKKATDTAKLSSLRVRVLQKIKSVAPKRNSKSALPNKCPRIPPLDSVQNESGDYLGLGRIKFVPADSISKTATPPVTRIPSSDRLKRELKEAAEGSILPQDDGGVASLHSPGQQEGAKFVENQPDNVDYRYERMERMLGSMDSSTDVWNQARCMGPESEARHRVRRILLKEAGLVEINPEQKSRRRQSALRVSLVRILRHGIMGPINRAMVRLDRK